jgi:hypothetical protein
MNGSLRGLFIEWLIQGSVHWMVTLGGSSCDGSIKGAVHWMVPSGACSLDGSFWGLFINGYFRGLFIGWFPQGAVHWMGLFINGMIYVVVTGERASL